MRFIFTLHIFLLVTCSCFSQSNAWTPVTFPLTKDTVSLEDMSGGTTATFNPTAFNSTTLLDFPSGFTFKLGLTSFSKFSISAYGYIKLGILPNAINPTSQDSIISALYAFPSTYPTCSYKLTGTAPNRILVIDWNGTLLSSGPARFQLWLYERIGRIQFVYNTIRAYSLGNAYAIFSKIKILGINSVASIKTRPLNQTPIANYTAIESNNYDSIYAKSRFTFQPDTIKPVKPGNLSFANVQPGCFDVVFTDSSLNESLFRLEKLDTGINYNFLKNIPSTTPLTQGTLYTHGETRMQPDSLYKYRVFASNGFVNSDTVFKEIRTPMPFITGLQRIPGDYPSINALLQDAECKHLGPNLVIELQNNYSYALEPVPVRFKRNLQTKVLRNVTIRPAANASLTLSSSAPFPLFTIDSVKFIGFDGRQGGTGNTISMVIQQLDTLRPAISYVHYADSGVVQYCNIEGRSRNGTYGLVYLGYKDASWNNFPPGVSGTTVRNCKIGSVMGTNEKLVVLDNNGRGDSIVVEGNEFFRFREAAVESIFGGTGTRVSKNRFYQPEQIIGNTTSIRVLDHRGYCLIDSNKIGGSIATWGVGKWSSYGFADVIPMIDLSSLGGSGHGVIRGNEFGNISLTGGRLQMIRAGNCETDIENNKIGTVDSTNSVVCESHNYVIGLSGHGTKRVKNNFFSGVQADYPTRTGNQDLVMVTSFFMDSLIITGNDFGGSDYRYSNYTGGQARCISMGGIKNAIIINNEIRGITSKNYHAFGIEQEWSGVSPVEKSMIADSNRIHHLQGRLTVYGIYSRVYSAKTNRFNNNKIYALRAIGPHAAIGASQPSFTAGIMVDHYFPPPNHPSIIDSSLVEVMNNQIHSFEYYYSTPPVYIYWTTGIGVSASRVKVNNNMVQLGIAANGQSTDSVELDITGIFLAPRIRGEIEHNSIYIGGRGSSSTGLDFSTSNFSNGNKNVFVTNNIIQIDRKSGSTISPDYPYFVRIPSSNTNAVVANKNIWYSQTHTDVGNRLALWRSRCACDSATFIADPKYINPAGDSLTQNLHLQSASPADSAGIPSVGNIPKDIDDQVRINYSPVDIGADAITPCSGNPTNVQLQLNPDKDLVEICSGTDLPLTVSVTGGTITQWQWQRNLNDIAGATATNYTVTQPGSYRVVGKLPCGKIASRTIVVVNSPTNPIVKVSSLTPPLFCDSSRITLKAEFISNAASPPQIRWFRNNVLLPGLTNAIESFDGIRLNDRYRAEVINDLSCGQFLGKDSFVISFVQISYRPKIQVVRYDTVRCSGNTDTIKYRLTNVPFHLPIGVLFVTPAPGATYQAIGDSLIVLQNLPNQSLQVRLYSIPLPALSCYYPDTSQVLNIVYLPTIAPVATVSGNSIVSNSPLYNQWYASPDSLIVGATDQTFVPTAPGNYFVRVILGNCVSAKSNIVNFVFTGLPQVNPPKQDMQLFPNPTIGQIWLKSEKFSGNIVTELIGTDGNLIQTDRLLLQRNVPLMINLRKTSHGIFFLRVSLKDKTYLFKIVILE